ncbi:MAG: DNA repair protein RadC [Sphingopyxis sp.]
MASLFDTPTDPARRNETIGAKGEKGAPGDHAGHRARLRDRLLQAGADALADHELVEYLLTLAIPRRDTKALAKALLHEFGGIGPLASADAESLRRVPGMGDTSAAAIKIVQAFSQRILHGAIVNRPVLGNWQGLLDYLRHDMAHRLNECVHVLHLDSRNHLIRDEVVSEGSIDQSAIYVREVIRRALDLGSAAIILVHNHPSGDFTPSRQDIAITRDIADACKRLSIALHDHIIISSAGHSSLRSQGLI